MIFLAAGRSNKGKLMLNDKLSTDILFFNEIDDESVTCTQNVCQI